MQAYSNPDRESDPYALPDLEIFYARAGELEWDDQQEPSEAGWYYCYCFPGCMPDSDPFGPFTSENEALSDARDNT